MYVVKTALRESFDNIHVGFRYSNKDKTIKIETDRGKISGREWLDSEFFPDHFMIVCQLSV